MHSVGSAGLSPAAGCPLAFIGGECNDRESEGSAARRSPEARVHRAERRGTRFCGRGIANHTRGPAESVGLDMNRDAQGPQPTPPPGNPPMPPPMPPPMMDPPPPIPIPRREEPGGPQPIDDPPGPPLAATEARPAFHHRPAP